MKIISIISIVLIIFVAGCQKEGEKKVITNIVSSQPVQKEEPTFDVKVLEESNLNELPDEELIPIILWNGIIFGGVSEESIYRLADIYDPSKGQKERKEVYDSRLDTSWKTENEGIGEYLIFTIYGYEKYCKREDRNPYAIKIINGNAKDQESFVSYNRAKQVLFEVYEVPEIVDYENHEVRIPEENIRLRYQQRFELVDTTNWQRVMLNYPTDLKGYAVGRFIIEDVYRGVTNQTCISELRWIYF